MRETVRRAEHLVGCCKDKAPRISMVGEGEVGGSYGLWDKMGLGLRHTRGLHNLSRLLSCH